MMGVLRRAAEARFAVIGVLPLSGGELRVRSGDMLLKDPPVARRPCCPRLLYAAFGLESLQDALDGSLAHGGVGVHDLAPARARRGFSARSFDPPARAGACL